MSTDELPARSFPEAQSIDGVNLRAGRYADADGLPVPSGLDDGAIYCIYPRAFSAEGTLASIVPELDRIAALGVSALWLLPIHPIGEERRKGSVGCPYSIRDYRTIHPDLGTEDDLRHLVRSAHDRNLRVLIDFVANHAAHDHVEEQRHPEWFNRNEHGETACRVGSWSDVVDWRFDEPGVSDYLIESALRWTRDFGVDGFRCDVAGMVPGEFWESLHRALATPAGHPLLLAEWQDPRLHTIAFHASYDWVLYRALRDTASGRVGAQAVIEALESWEANFPRRALPLRFVENHDEPRAAAVFGRDRLPAYTAVAFLSGGWPLVYAGQEGAASHRPSLFEREPIGAALRPRENGSGLSRLLAIRSRPPWRHGSTVGVGTDRPETVVAFRRMDGEAEGLLIANLGRDPETVRPEISGSHRRIHEASGPEILEPSTPLTLSGGAVWIGERIR